VVCVSLPPRPAQKLTLVELLQNISFDGYAQGPITFRHMLNSFLRMYLPRPWLDDVHPVTKTLSNLTFLCLRVSRFNSCGANCRQNVLGLTGLRLVITTKSPFCLFSCCSFVLCFAACPPVVCSGNSDRLVSSSDTDFLLTRCFLFTVHAQANYTIAQRPPRTRGAMVRFLCRHVKRCLHVFFYIATSYAGLCLDRYIVRLAAPGLRMKGNV
jgi:hypothetical protein